MAGMKSKGVVVLSVLLLAAGCGARKRAEHWEAVKRRTSMVPMTKSDFEVNKSLLQNFIDEYPESDEAQQANAQLIVVGALESIASDRELKEVTKEAEQALAGGRIDDAERALSHGTFRDPASPDYAGLRERIRQAREAK
jgi:hypothetical protein